MFSLMELSKIKEKLVKKEVLACIRDMKMYLVFFPSFLPLEYSRLSKTETVRERKKIPSHREFESSQNGLKTTKMRRYFPC